jgi:hypothetical protein
MIGGVGTRRIRGWCEPTPTFYKIDLALGPYRLVEFEPVPEMLRFSELYMSVCDTEFSGLASTVTGCWVEERDSASRAVTKSQKQLGLRTKVSRGRCVRNPASTKT